MKNNKINLELTRQKEIPNEMKQLFGNSMLQDYMTNNIYSQKSKENRKFEDSKLYMTNKNLIKKQNSYLAEPVKSNPKLNFKARDNIVKDYRMYEATPNSKNQDRTSINFEPSPWKSFLKTEKSSQNDINANYPSGKNIKFNSRKYDKHTPVKVINKDYLFGPSENSIDKKKLKSIIMEKHSKTSLKNSMRNHKNVLYSQMKNKLDINDDIIIQTSFNSDHNQNENTWNLNSPSPKNIENSLERNNSNNNLSRFKQYENSGSKVTVNKNFFGTDFVNNNKEIYYKNAENKIRINRKENAFFQTEITPIINDQTSPRNSEDRDTIVNVKPSTRNKNYQSLINSSQSINETLKNLDRHTEKQSREGIKKEEMMEIMLLHKSLKNKIKYLEDKIEKY